MSSIDAKRMRKDMTKAMKGMFCRVIESTQSLVANIESSLKPGDFPPGHLHERVSTAEQCRFLKM